MTKRRRILHADKIIQNVVHVFCLLMFLQLKDYYTVASNPILLYSTATDIRVANISKPGKVNAIIKGLEQASAVDFLFTKNLLCWSDQTTELIQCMEYNGTYAGEKMQIVSEGLITPSGIAIDWYTNKIYWTDGDTNRIEVISIEQKYRKVLFWSEVDLARAIAVVPKEGLMFWTDWGEVPKIEKAGMNGDPSTRQVIIKEDIFWPNGITIDFNNNLIYWVDAKLKFIDVIDFNGLNRKRVVKGGLEYPYALAFFNDKLYWTDWKHWAILSLDIVEGGPIKELIKSDPVPVDIKVFDASRQLPPATDCPCAINNGGCSHLCLLAPNAPGYMCACPTGVKLQPNSNTTCYSGPQSLLLVAQRSLISKISLDSPDFTPYTLPLKDLKRALTVDFDPKTEFFYWADSLAKTISRARLDGSEQSVVIHSSGLPDSIAIDPLARNIYWTDPVADTITVARLDGSSRKVIIHEELYDPRAIALHPTAGLMFWSDWNEKRPKIERANLDGSARQLIVSERVTWPNGMALDTVNNKLYWGDARTHKIEVCKLDGSDRRELHGGDILHIFGLTLLGRQLYWTDMQRRTLDRIDKDTGLDREPVVEQMPNMMGTKAFRLNEPLGWNQCADSNGGCSHFCFNRPQDYVCSCPLGLELGSDRKTCVEPEAFLVYSRKNVIGRLSIENDDNDAIFPIKDLKEVSALAVHVAGEKIYWADSKARSISRCDVDASNVEKILEGVGLVEGLAIDWSGQNIYWTDTAMQRIEVARLDGSSRRALIWQGLKKPKSIVLDPKKGLMYWSELGSKVIKRAAMDGSGITVFMEQVGRVHSLAIDYERRALYWAALDAPAVEAAYLNGTGRRLLADNVPMPYALAVFNDRVFWGDWNTGVIEEAQKRDGSHRRAIHTQLDYITDLKVFHRAGGGGDGGGNQCGADSGGCAQLCLATPDDFRCACPTHYRLNKDNLTCSEPEEFLLFAQKNAIGRIVIAPGECNDAYIPLTGLKSVKAIEYDPVNKMLYWIEEESHAIRRVPISYSSTSAASDSSPVVAGPSRPLHLALDVLGRTLYWSCADGGSINATHLDGNSSGVVLSGGNMMPRHLAFHQTKRYLIWNDVGLGAIMRASVDGSGRVELARAGNGTALAVEQAAGTVYWAAGRQVLAVDLDGRNRRVVWQGGWSWSLAALGPALFLAAPDRALMRLSPQRRDPPAPAVPVPHVPRAVVAIAVHKVPRSHPCWLGGGCGAGPASCGPGGQCGCGLRCPAPAPASRGPHGGGGPEGPSRCGPNHFVCLDAPDHCIPQQWKCDGQVDCPDGSDESAVCGECPGGEGGGGGGAVRCVDGSCGESVGACGAAGGAVCALRPLPDGFRCDSRLCLPPRLLCDGHQHCEDGSDEAPEACGFAQKDQVVRGGSRQSNALVVCGAIVGAVGGAAGAVAALRRWHRHRGHRPGGAGGAAGARGGRGPPYPHPRPAHAQPLMPLKPLPLPTAMHHTDYTSSLTSSSLCARYPRPTANPPPSPATGSSGQAAAGAGAPPPAAPPPRRRPYRHYRASNRVPPPTPASTDACESEPEPGLGAPPPSPEPDTEPYSS